MSKTRRRTRKTWESVPDDILCINSPRTALDRPESLCPTLSTIDHFVAGMPEAQAIIHSYQLVAPIIEVRTCA